MTRTGERLSATLARVRRVLGNPWVKAAATLLIILCVVYWLRGQMPFIEKGFTAVGRPRWDWLALALLFSFLSMSSYGSVQKTLLGSAGVRVGYWDSVGLIFAANAFSTCIPGGQVFGATLTYRRTRQWGATRVIASWQLVISGVLSTVGLVLLAVAGFFLVGTVSNPFLLAASVVGLVTIVFVIQWATRNPDKIETVLLGALGWVNDKRRRPRDRGADGVRAVVEQAEAVEMSRGQLARAFAWSLLNWVADVGCLWAAAETVGVHHSAGGLCIAYVTGKVVGTAPVTPGGLGTVEFALITALTAGGLPAAQAFATVFVYRVVSFLLVALAGWVVFFLVYRKAVEIDPDADEDDDGREGYEDDREGRDAELAGDGSTDGLPELERPAGAPRFTQPVGLHD